MRKRGREAGDGASERSGGRSVERAGEEGGRTERTSGRSDDRTSERSV